MLIDWFTVVAQLVNFLIIVIVLKVLLFDRVVRIIDQRRQMISAQLEETEEQNTRAQLAIENYESRRRELEAHRHELVHDAKKEAAAVHQRLVDEARRDVEHRAHEWRASLERQHQELVGDMVRRSGDAALALSRRALADLAGLDLEARLIDRFVVELKSLDDAERVRIAETVVDHPVTIVTSFELDPDLREQLESVVRDFAGVGAAIRYQHDQELVCGVVVRFGPRELSWSIDGYMEEIAEHYARFLREHIEDPPHPQIEADEADAQRLPSDDLFTPAAGPGAGRVEGESM